MEKSKHLFLLVVYTLGCVCALFLWMLRPSLSASKKSKGSIRKLSTAGTIDIKNRLRIMTYNIGYASGLHNNQPKALSKKEVSDNLIKLSQYITQSDCHIACIQEIDIAAKRTHFIDQIDVLMKNTQLKHAAIAITWDLNWLPYPGPWWAFWQHFGKIISAQAILSCFPITKQTLHPLEKPRNRSWIYQKFYLNKVFQVADIAISPYQTMSIGNVHLEAFHNVTRQQQTKQIHTLLQSNSFNPPLIIAGDLNTVDPESPLQAPFGDNPILSYYNDTTLAQFNENHFSEIFIDSPTRKRYETLYTYPTSAPNRRLDYIFYEAEKVSVFHPKVDQSAGTASDHFPVIADVHL